MGSDALRSSENESNLSRRLIISVAGELSPSRLEHVKKILAIVEPMQYEIVLVSEGQPVELLGSYSIRAEGSDMADERRGESFVLRLLWFVRKEIARSRIVRSVLSKDAIVLFMGIYQPLVLLVSKLGHGTTVIFGGGFDVFRSAKRNKLLDKAFLLLRWTLQISMLKFIDRIICESPSVLAHYRLQRFVSKSFVKGHLFVDTNHFAPSTAFRAREVDMGFVGALSPEKGPDKFIESLPLILKKRPINAVMIGDGILRRRIEDFISNHGLQNAVELKGWVRYSDMPAQLNKMKLLVVPSFSEGLPNIILEAMACGTLVLATNVGGIPSVVKDGETGFLLRSTNPSYIAKKIVELFDYIELLENIQQNARKVIIENFTRKKATEIWLKAFTI